LDGDGLVRDVLVVDAAAQGVAGTPDGERVPHLGGLLTHVGDRRQSGRRTARCAAWRVAGVFVAAASQRRRQGDRHHGDCSTSHGSDEETSATVHLSQYLPNPLQPWAADLFMAAIGTAIMVSG